MIFNYTCTCQRDSQSSKAQTGWREERALAVRILLAPSLLCSLCKTLDWALQGLPSISRSIDTILESLFSDLQFRRPYPAGRWEVKTLATTLLYLESKICCQTRMLLRLWWVSFEDISWVQNCNEVLGVFHRFNKWSWIYCQICFVHQTSVPSCLKGPECGCLHPVNFPLPSF